jgi:hypothetical protein
METSSSGEKSGNREVRNHMKESLKREIILNKRKEEESHGQ